MPDLTRNTTDWEAIVSLSVVFSCKLWRTDSFSRVHFEAKYILHLNEKVFVSAKEPRILILAIY